MTTKQRAYLKSLAMKIEPIFQIGKSSMSPGLTEAVSEALEAGASLPISEEVLNMYKEIASDGMEDLGTQALIKFYEKEN